MYALACVCRAQSVGPLYNCRIGGLCGLKISKLFCLAQVTYNKIVTILSLGPNEGKQCFGTGFAELYIVVVVNPAKD
jgi:hypothetical protein